MRSEEVVISYEECGEHGGAVGVFETAPCTSVELVSAIKTFDKLF